MRLYLARLPPSTSFVTFIDGHTRIFDRRVVFIAFHRWTQRQREFLIREMGIVDACNLLIANRIEASPCNFMANHNMVNALVAREDARLRKDARQAVFDISSR